MDKLLVRLAEDFPQLCFAAGPSFCWSPATGQILYKQSAPDDPSPQAVFSLLHETGHALLGHKRYRLDFELLELEVSAWERAKHLAAQYGITIDEDHIQDCLDTYRDWLYRRSICPSCTTKALQQDGSHYYQCFNCRATWRVSPSRFCRPYRQTKHARKAAPVFASHYPRP